MKIKIVPLLVLAYAMFAMSGVHADPPQFKVLMISTTNGWHHDAISEAVPAIRGLAAKHQFEVVWEENVDRMFTGESLQEYDVILFVLTTGEEIKPPWGIPWFQSTPSLSISTAAAEARAVNAM